MPPQSTMTNSMWSEGLQVQTFTPSTKSATSTSRLGLGHAPGASLHDSIIPHGSGEAESGSSVA